MDLTDPWRIVSKGDFHADHSLVVGRAAGRGHRVDGHTRDLRPAPKRGEKQRKKSTWRLIGPAPWRGFFLSNDVCEKSIAGV